MAQRAVICQAPYMHNGKLFLPGILVHTATRAVVLVEMGFVSDVHVAEAMNTATWVARTASALDAGIRQWAKGDKP